jgi:dihydrofolate reductase
MPKIAANISTSLDGYVAGPNDGPDNGLGDRGDRLHQWLYDLESWREPHGLEGGDTNRNAEVFEETFATTGASVVGKRMFDNARGWGDEPPFHMPVFVLTHERRDPLEKNGGTTFTFVEGIENAVEQARTAAGERDVAIGGGASVIQQAIAAGLLDELQIHLVPVLLGGGVPLFGPETTPAELDSTRVIDSPDVTHLKFRVKT